MSKLSWFKLLAIEDDPQNRASIVETFSPEGMEILTAGDPDSGFELFLQARPRNVVLDLKVPEAAAMDLLERMVRTDPSVNVILVADRYSEILRSRQFRRALAIT